MVKLLLANGADAAARTSTWGSNVFGKGSGQTPAHWAAESDHAEVLLLLLSHSDHAGIVTDDRDQAPRELVWLIISSQIRAVHTSGLQCTEVLLKSVF